MTTYALIRTDAPAAVIERRDFAVLDPIRSPKPLHWIPDTPPAYDPQIQRLVEISPVPVDALEVPYTVVDIPLYELRAARKKALEDKRFAVETGGIVFAGIAVKTDRESQGLVSDLQRSIADGIIASVQFKTASGAIIDADAATANAIRNAVVNHIQACRSKEADLAQAIDAAADAATVLAVDIDSGWPPNA